MRFEDSFVVPVAVQDAWEVLTDIERVAPCLPGAELVEIRGNEFHGIVRLKLGPIAANYRGIARFDSLDEGNRRIVIVAQGRDRNGQGTATTHVEMTLIDDDGATTVKMVQSVDITGKAAQFGRGVVADVSRQMMDRFANSLTEMLTAPAAPSPAHGAVGRSKPVAHSVGATAPESIDVWSVARRIVTDRSFIVAAIVGFIVIGLLVRRRRR